MTAPSTRSRWPCPPPPRPPPHSDTEAEARAADTEAAKMVSEGEEVVKEDCVITLDRCKHNVSVILFLRPDAASC